MKLINTTWRVVITYWFVNGWDEPTTYDAEYVVTASSGHTAYQKAFKQFKKLLPSFVDDIAEISVTWK